MAISANSASALPEWGKCEAKAGGKYLDSNCTKKGSLKNPGQFEFKKGNPTPVHFQGENIGSGGILRSHFLHCEGGTFSAERVPRKKCEEGGGTIVETEEVTIECESEHNVGEATGLKEVKNIEVRFKGCKAFGTAPCANTTNEGEILVNLLKGSLGYINKAKKEVGLLLEPAIKKGEFAKFNCAGIITTVVGVGNEKEGAFYTPEKTGGYDGIISPITPVNTMTNKYKQVFTVSVPADQNIPSHFEGKHNEVLENYICGEGCEKNTNMWSPAGEEITNENTAEAEAEIKA